MRWKRPKLSKFKVVVSVLLVAMVATAYATVIVVKDISWLQGELKLLYGSAEHAHSGMLWWAIETAEADLQQKLTHLKILAVAMALLVVSLMTSIKLKHSTTLD